MVAGQSDLPLYRYVVVVPRSAPDTLQYLTESFRNVPDVHVVLDRRRPVTESAGEFIERRGCPSAVQAFGCTLVRVVPVMSTARKH